jgi:tRNA-2-methylthio-N6-dimethylallyladenosine synthase
MAERVKEKFLEHDNLVDIVVGPDAYRDLPRLIDGVAGVAGATAVNVQLSLDETYADIAPVRRGGDHHAFVSITRGCDNMCR